MTEKEAYTSEELKTALENEKLDDAELDQVAGGAYGESHHDMMLLRQHCGIHFDLKNRDNAVNKLGALYNRAGTIFKAHNSEDHQNKYFDGNGRLVSHHTAIHDLIHKINTGAINVNDLR